MPNELVLRIMDIRYNRKTQRLYLTEVVNIWGPWIPKNEIEGCLSVDWAFVISYPSTYTFWLIELFNHKISTTYQA